MLGFFVNVCFYKVSHVLQYAFLPCEKSIFYLVQMHLFT